MASGPVPTVDGLVDFQPLLLGEEVTRDLLRWLCLVTWNSLTLFFPFCFKVDDRLLLSSSYYSCWLGRVWKFIDYYTAALLFSRGEND